MQLVDVKITIFEGECLGIDGLSLVSRINMLCRLYLNLKEKGVTCNGI